MVPKARERKRETECVSVRKGEKENGGDIRTKIKKKKSWVWGTREI